MAFIVPALLVATVLNFIEHFIALPNVGWVLPFSVGGFLWVMARAGREWEGLRLPAILFAAVFTWALFIRCLNPSISPSNDATADLARLVDFCLGGTLPALDSWCPPYDHGGIASFQFYAASLLKRLFWLDVGTAYNIAYTLLNALTCLAGVGAAYAITGRKTWVAVATLVVLLANFTGAAVILLYWNNAHPISGFYHVFDSSLAVDIGTGWNDTDRHNPFGWIFRNPPPELHLFAPASYIYLAVFGAELGGLFLTLASLLAANEIFKTERSNWAWICLIVFPLITIITATGSMIVVSVLCAVGFAAALLDGRRPGDWKIVMGGSALAFVFFWPSINALVAQTPLTDFHWTPRLEYTPLWEFVIQWWPLIVPWFALCFIWHRLSPLARWIHLAVPLLLIFFEVVTFGNRGQTTESNWGAIYGIGLVTFLPLIFILTNPGFRILTIFYLSLAAIFVVAWGWMTVASVGDNTAFHLKGDAAIQNDSQKKRLLQMLSQIHGKTVLNQKDPSATNLSPLVVGLSENRCYIGWFDPENQSGHGDEAESREKQSNDFFAGTMPYPLAFLRSHNIAAVMIWPDDAIPDNLLQKFKDQLASDYYYVDAKGGASNNAGIFLRNPSPQGFPLYPLQPVR